MFWSACCRKDHVCRSYPCSTSCPSCRKKAGRGSQAGHCIPTLHQSAIQKCANMRSFFGLRQWHVPLHGHIAYVCHVPAPSHAHTVPTSVLLNSVTAHPQTHGPEHHTEPWPLLSHRLVSTSSSPPSPARLASLMKEAAASVVPSSATSRAAAWNTSEG
jgi:hypothetical protein